MEDTTEITELNKSKSDLNDEETFWRNVLDILNQTFIKQMKIGIDRPVEENDFIEQKNYVGQNFNLILKLFSDAIKNDGCINFKNLTKNLKNEVTICTLLLCGEHSCLNDAWTTSDTVQLSTLITKVLCDFYSINNVDEFFGACCNTNLLPMIFNRLRPKLLKDTWKYYPAAVSSYVWILLKIKTPNMGSILHLVMPTTLILIDDYINTNRVIGLRCFQHIIENVTKTELSWYCELDVLYKTLEPMLYNLEPDMVKPLINSMIVLINKKISVEEKLKWNHFDDMLNILLPSIEMEQKLALRSEYMESIPFLFQSMGLSCVRWSKRLIRIFEEYAAVSQDRENCFKAIHMFITVTWPRTSSYFPQLITIILKSLLDLMDENQSDDKSNRENSIKSVVDCLDILRDIVPKDMEQLCIDINNNKMLSSSFKSFFKVRTMRAITS